MAPHLLNNQFCGFALVKIVNTVIGNAFQRVRQVRLNKPLARLPGGAIVLIECVQSGRPAGKSLSGLFQPLGKPGGDDESVAGQPDGG